MSSARVFVVQDPRRAAEDGTLVRRFDLSPALEYGPLHYLLSPSARPFNFPAVSMDLRVGLEDFTDADYLLLVGNPILIGAAFAVAAHRTGGRVKALQWSGTEGRYVAVQVGELFEVAG